MQPWFHAITDNYARIYQQLREDAQPIPTNDMWIAACALREDCALFTLDAHFDAIRGLRVVHRRDDFEWLVRPSS